VRGDVAGKTGTTQDNADGWFILMQPGLVAGAWVGFDDGRVTLRSDYGGRARTARCRSSASSSSGRSARGSSMRS
jgi:membrane carboxypeptidase/penicillin-binding protein